ncbi:SET domain-containing protein [Coprinopsis marcescibilis]|uniref:SET domain-containing protein n=1 Tax=Coprinopsis marcescibilis TaxID=230819 RepID=A0A5C3L8J7_COPMA|nr:SET domain-containing protein [Coprinopsis marcescibilis]
MEDPGVPGGTVSDDGLDEELTDAHPGPDNRSFGKALGVSWLDDMSSGAEGRRAGTPVNAVDDDVFVKEQQLSPQLPASDKGKFRASEVTSRPPSTAASCVPSATSISVTGPAKATMDLAEAYNSRAQAHASTSTSTSIPSAGPGATGDGKKRKTKKAKKKRAPPPPVGMTGGGSKDDPLDLTELLESDGDGGVEVMTKASKGKEKHKENEDTGVKKGKGKEESKSSSSSAAASRAGSKTARGKGKGAGEAVNDKERERQKSTFRAAAAALSGMTSTPAPTSVSAFKSVSTAHGTPSSLATTLPIVKGTKPLRYSVSQNSSPVLGERSVVDSETKTEGAAPSTIDTTRPRSASAIRSVDFSRIPFAGIPPLSLDGEVDIEADPDVDLDMHPPTSASASSTRPSSRSSAARMVDARDEENEVDERHIPFSPSSPAPPTITVSGKGKGKERAAPTSPTVDKTTIRGMAPPPPTGSTEVGFDFGEARGDDGSASDDALMEVADMLVSSGSVRSTPGVANITDALGSQDLGEETRRPEGTLEGAKNIVSAVASTSSTSVSSTSTPSTPKTPADDYGGPDFREHVDEEEEFGRREEFSVTTSRTSDKKSYGGYECLTFNDYRQSIKDNPFEVYYARDLPHQLQDFINAMDQEQIRNLPGMTQVFEAFILEHTVLDEPDAPPIKVINEVDHEPTPPWEFQYSNRMWHSDNVPPPDVKNLEGCDCIGGCDPRSKTCKCLKKQMDAIAMVDAAGAEGEEGPVLPMQHEFAYDKAGRLRQPGYPIFECNSLCGCDEDCRNRVVQNGRKVAVSIQKTEHKGWGVFAGPKKIPRGTFLGIYAGEILSEEEGQTRGLVYNKFGRTYLFDLDFYHLQVDEDWDVKYVVDAYQVGNFTRFLNHSCSPNCRIYPCYINEANIDKPLLSVFADRDIEPFEEICFNYNGDQADDLATRAENTQNPASQKRDAIYQRCMCGAENCTGLMFK